MLTVEQNEFNINNMEIGSVIKKYRKENSVTMEKFAAMCGLSKGYISILENGVNPVSGKAIRPSIETIAQIAAVMQITIDELYRMAGGKYHYVETHEKTLKFGESIEPYHAAETIKAYFDGSCFVPVKPVSISKNQPVAVTVLSEYDMTPEDTARQAARQLFGMLSGSGMSSEAFAERKRFEKELER